MERSQDSVFKMTGLLDGLTATDPGTGSGVDSRGCMSDGAEQLETANAARGQDTRQQWSLGCGLVPGAAIGDYHVLGLLGVGGMGPCLSRAAPAVEAS